MTKRTFQVLGLALLAAPLAIVGCSDSGDKDDGGGGTGVKFDGGGGALGKDAGAEAQAPVADAQIVVDTQVPVDTTLPDAPLGPDAPALDGGALDVNALDTSLVDTRPPAVDTASIEAQAVDTTPAIDTTPAVCTETTKFKGGAVTASRTLSKACSPYTISSDISVNGNATLTIEPGVTLKFDPDAVISIGYNAAAKLTAVGTAAEPIVFTSSNTTPGAGDWRGVQLWENTMNGTSLGYVKFDYCGSNGDACLIGSGVKANRVTVDHVTFSHVGAGSDAIWEKDRDSSFAITSCTFNDIPATPTQQYAITVYAQSFAGIDSTNVFNGSAMVQIVGGTIATNTTWKNIGAPVAVTSDISIEGTASPTLTVAAGGVFKFSADTKLSLGYNGPGKLTLAGTATAGITLTTLASTPGAGDWIGIVLWDGSSAKISYTTISYAGSDKGAIRLDSDGTTLDIQSSTIDHSATAGISLRCSSAGKVTNTGNTFTANVGAEVDDGCN
jgi:hypothetical protein